MDGDGILNDQKREEAYKEQQTMLKKIMCEIQIIKEELDHLEY